MHIDGVNGTHSPIEMAFLAPEGAKTGKLLPTGNSLDWIDGVAVTCVDVSVPLVIVGAHSLSKCGKESKQDYDSDPMFMARLESIRQKASLLMGLGDCRQKVIPKICIISLPEINSNQICSRYFTPFDCHSSHAVSAAMALASSLFIRGSITADMLGEVLEPSDGLVKIEHPSGVIPISYEFDVGSAKIKKMGFYRTAKELMRGYFFY